MKWKHFPRYWPFVRGIHRSPVNSPQKGQWRGALMFSLICLGINGWVNNRKAGDLRRYRAHYDVIVMAMSDIMTATLADTLPLIHFNSSLPEQDGRHFADNSFRCIFLNENDRIPIWISLKFVPTSPIDNKPALVQVMAWRRTGDKSLPEPLLTQFNDAYMRHYRGRWVNVTDADNQFSKCVITILFSFPDLRCVYQARIKIPLAKNINDLAKYLQVVNSVICLMVMFSSLKYEGWLEGAMLRSYISSRQRNNPITGRSQGPIFQLLPK